MLVRELQRVPENPSAAGDYCEARAEGGCTISALSEQYRSPTMRVE
jgi:hypothetical protein